MRAALFLTLIGVALLAEPSHSESPQETTRYFSWAQLKTNPAKPTDEITLEEAQAREAAGEAYYIATFDTLGRLRSLEKRLGGKTFFRYGYAYPDGEPVRSDAPKP